MMTWNKREWFWLSLGVTLCACKGDLFPVEEVILRAGNGTDSHTEDIVPVETDSDSATVQPEDTNSEPPVSDSATASESDSEKDTVTEVDSETDTVTEHDTEDTSSDTRDSESVIPENCVCMEKEICEQNHLAFDPTVPCYENFKCCELKTCDETPNASCTHKLTTECYDLRGELLMQFSLLRKDPPWYNPVQTCDRTVGLFCCLHDQRIIKERPCLAPYSFCAPPEQCIESMRTPMVASLDCPPDQACCLDINLLGF